MTYAILPGAEIADAVEHGYALNLPLRVRTGSSVPAPAPLVSTHAHAAIDSAALDSAVIEAVKLADDRSGDVIVRLYESAGGRAHSRLTTAFSIAAAEPCDLLERPLAGQSMAISPDGSLDLALRPFQILTLRLRRG
jgi:alpha-mannosidase